MTQVEVSPTARRGRLKLLLMAAICLAPVLASWAVYRLMPPQGGKSYGQLLPTRPFVLTGAQGWPRGKWVLAARIEPVRQARCQQRFSRCVRSRSPRARPPAG